MTRLAKEKAFSKETDLCAAFIDAVNRGDFYRPGRKIESDWVCYSETAGWDLLLSRRSDGFQIGIEAKLSLNGKVLLQAAEGPWADRRGPDCRAVLVPADSNTELAGLAAYCAITVIRMRHVGGWAGGAFSPSLPHAERRSYGNEDWHELMPSRRHPLPEFVPDVAAGAPCPVRLTPWKIGAMKLAILLEASGFLLRADFKRHGIDIRRWIASGWIVAGADGFHAGAMPIFRTQHPRVWEEIAADKEQWARADMLVP